jgi:hypothetical protein
MRYGAIELERANGADILRHFVPVARGSASPPSRSMFIHGIWVFPDPAQAVAAKRSPRVSSPALRKVCSSAQQCNSSIPEKRCPAYLCSSDLNHQALCIFAHLVKCLFLCACVRANAFKSGVPAVLPGSLQASAITLLLHCLNLNH